jgi:cytidylate kinase
MPIIAITREMGSLGKDVATELGDALGIPVIYHEVIEHLADRMRVRKSHVIRLLDGKAGLLERMTADKTSMSIYTADEVYGLALEGKGAVIRGWGATHLLHEVPHAVCVRICAPLEDRQRRMIERLGAGDAHQVAEEIRINDEAHAAVMRRHFDLQWTDSEHYDLSLNTGRVSVAACVEEVLGLVRSAEFTETEASRARLADLALSARVRAALRVSPRTRDIHIMASALGGRVTLAGMVASADERKTCAEVVQGVAGVREIDDQLRAVDALRPRFS